MDCLDEMTVKVQFLFIANGTHVVEIYDFYRVNEGLMGLGESNMLEITFPISIIGESRDHCVVVGGLHINGGNLHMSGNGYDVNVSNLTICDSQYQGVYGFNGASIHLDNVSIERSGKQGVYVDGTQRNSMKNCNVSYSKYSGLYVHNGIMNVHGDATTLHHNGTADDFQYDLDSSTPSSFIHIVSLLLEWYVVQGDGTYGGEGTIDSFDRGKITVIQDPTVEESEESEEDESEEDEEEGANGGQDGIVDYAPRLRF